MHPKEEEKRLKRLEKSKMERERQLQREKEQEEAAMVRRQQEEEERQKAERLKCHQEEQRRLQSQARKEEEKRRFEQLLASGTTLVKPPVPTPTASSNANRFIQVSSISQNRATCRSACTLGGSGGMLPLKLTLLHT